MKSMTNYYPIIRLYHHKKIDDQGRYWYISITGVETQRCRQHQEFFVTKDTIYIYCGKECRLDAIEYAYDQFISKNEQYGFEYLNKKGLDIYNNNIHSIPLGETYND